MTSFFRQKNLSVYNKCVWSMKKPHRQLIFTPLITHHVKHIFQGHSGIAVIKKTDTDYHTYKA